MRAPYTQLYLHCVWSTYKRLPLILPGIQQRVYAGISAKCRELNCHVLAIGGDVDHVHLFVRFPTTLAVATLLKEVKGATSQLVNHEIAPGEAFRWQGGYGAFTVSKRSAESVTAYVRNQRGRHANRQLIDELERCEEHDDYAREEIE